MEGMSTLLSGKRPRHGFQTDDPALEPIVAKVECGERLSFDDGLALYRSGAVKPLIQGRFPLERADEALASLAGRGSVGKVVLVK